MYSKIWLLALVGLLTTSKIGAAAPVEVKMDKGTVAFSLWSSTGDQEFVSSFLANSNAGSTGPRVVSRLRYPLQGSIGEIAMEVPVNQRQSLKLGYGNSNLRPGQGDDTDWDYSQRPDMWYYGTFNTTGSTQYYHIDWIKKGSQYETFAGYRAQKNFFRMQDGHYSIDNYDPVNTDLHGLNSTYEITYQGLWIGTRGRHRVNDDVAVEGSIAYSPLMLVQGYGNWNLRDMTFEEKGMGQGLEGTIGISYKVNESIDASVGYRYRWMEQRSGEDVTQLAGDPTLYYAEWDKAVSVQRGIYGKVNVRF